MSEQLNNIYMPCLYTLHRYRHPNLLTLMGFCAYSDNFCLIYEFMSNGTLEEALASSVKAGAYKLQLRDSCDELLVRVIVQMLHVTM